MSHDVGECSNDDNYFFVKKKKISLEYLTGDITRANIPREATLYIHEQYNTRRKTPGVDLYLKENVKYFIQWVKDTDDPNFIMKSDHLLIQTHVTCSFFLEIHLIV